MQTTCPQCSQAILVDDAKIPERAFSIRCPRCKATVRLTGKTASEAPAAVAPKAPAAPAAPESATPPPSSSVAPDAGGSQALSPEPPGHRGRALLALGDGGKADALAPVLVRLGFVVDTSAGEDDAIRQVEQGVYSLVVTVRAIAPAGQAPTFYQRVGRLNSDSRRRLFVGLVGDDFRTGDGLQAFGMAADLVIHPRDLGSCGVVVRDALAERQRLYQVFLDARQRFESQ